MKRLLLLLLTIISLPAAVMPPKPTMASFESLPIELKQLILKHTADGHNGILNISALSQGITTLAATNKSLHTSINNPQNMLTFLKLLPKAGALVLVESLPNMPGIKSGAVKEWIKSTQDKLRNGKELYEAIHTDHPDLTVVTKILEDPDVDVNWKTTFNSNSLIAASFKGHKNIVKLLLKAGVNPNAKNNKGMNSLVFAIDNRHNEITRLLLDAGANVNTKKNNLTVLMDAAINGKVEIVETLLAAGADPFITSTQKVGNTNVNFTALMMARKIARLIPSRANELNLIIKLLEDAEMSQKEMAARK